jgi:Family of unknown function (DUF6011)
MATVTDLQSALPTLSPHDQDFARSLIAASARGLSTKQQFWVDKLVARAAAGLAGADRQTAAVGDMSGVLTLFANAAKSRLKRPAIVIALGQTPVRMTVATAKAQVPGSINVVGEIGGEWFGRILTTGTFEASRKYDAPAGLVDALVAFAADPAKVAGEYGRLHGRCCFCDLPLKDERSTVVGYGPTCAKHWALPWGKTEHSFACEGTALPQSAADKDAPKAEDWAEDAAERRFNRGVRRSIKTVAAAKASDDQATMTF